MNNERWFFEGDVLTFAGLVFVLSSLESLSNSTAVIIDLETVPRNPWLNADKNVTCPFKIFLKLKVSYALPIVLEMKLRNNAVAK